jgi:hypothetical protein
LARKRYAIDLITEWNKDTPARRERVHKVFSDLTKLPEGIDKESYCLCSDWSEERWAELYSATKSEDSKLRQLREDVVWMLNYWEAVAVSYEQGIADSKVIEGSLRHLMINWHECFGGFLLEAMENRGRNPLYPLSHTVQKWYSEMNGLASKRCADRNKALAQAK